MTTFRWLRRGLAVLVPAILLASPAALRAQSLSLNESKTVTVHANAPWNWAHIRLVKGQRYRFSVASPGWNNGSYETTAAGYDEPITAALRRHQGYRLMELVGEIFGSDNNVATYSGTAFRIGMGREYTASKTGFLVTLANDCGIGAGYAAPACYLDNSRVVTLTIKRIE